MLHRYSCYHYSTDRSHKHLNLTSIKVYKIGCMQLIEDCINSAISVLCTCTRFHANVQALELHYRIDIRFSTTESKHQNKVPRSTKILYTGYYTNIYRKKKSSKQSGDKNKRYIMLLFLSNYFIKSKGKKKNNVSMDLDGLEND